MLESMGVVESSISDHFSPEIHKKMSSQPLPLSDLNHTSSPAQFEPTSSCRWKVTNPWDKADEGERGFGAFSPLCSGDNRLLGSLFHNEGWWGKRKHKQNNLCDCELTDINLPPPLGISPSHSTTELRVENTFPEKLFFSCAFCGEGETIIEQKKGKNRRWKGQPCTITASSVPAPFLSCTSTASAWPHAGGACQGAVTTQEQKHHPEPCRARPGPSWELGCAEHRKKVQGHPQPHPCPRR